MKQVSGLRRRTRIFTLVATVFGVIAVGAFVGHNRIEKIAVAPAPAGTTLPTVVSLNATETAFYLYVGSKIRDLNAESAALVALGDARSRNLVQLQVRAGRIDDISGDIDSYLAANPAPVRFQPAIDQYRSGILVMRRGIAGTKASFSRLDFDGVAKALAVFKIGVATVVNSYDLIQVEAGAFPKATPSI